MKIDIFNHLFPKKFFDRYINAGSGGKDIGKRVANIQTIVDLDKRFRILDEFGDYVQVLSLPLPPFEILAGSEKSPQLAREGNDGLAELVQKYDRFLGFAASLPMNNPDAALKEMERALDQLGAFGVQIYSNAAGKPLDAPEFLPLFQEAVRRDIPIWMHPARGADFPDYQTETKSLYEIWWTFGWPYETSVAMARLVFAGYFDRFPTLKIITHHMGAMAPYFEGRVGPGWDQLGARTSDVDYSKLLRKLKKRPLDYFHLFYADTALFGAWEATKCGLSFFGPDRVLFASDSPFDPEKGSMYTRTTIEIVDRLDLSPEERHAIYEGNARRLLKLH